MKRILIKNISIKATNYEVQLPAAFIESPHLAKVYLRSELFQRFDVDYDTEELPMFEKDDKGKTNFNRDTC